MITKLRAQWMLSGMEQKEISARIGVSRSKISEWINGVAPIPVARIVQFCEIFHCNPQEVVGWTDEVLEKIRA